MLPDYLAKECYQFAVDVTHTTFKLYSKRQSNSNLDILINQHYKAKLTEWFVWFYLSKNNYLVSTPDMQVYDGHNKSYNADLRVFGRNINVHVKCMNKKIRSVLFEKDEVKHFKKNDYICIVDFINEFNMKIVCFKCAKDFIYSKPRKTMPSKLAIYL